MRGYTPKPTFDSLAKKSFASETQILDFSKNEESAAVINTWVEEFSNNKIKEIVKANELNALVTVCLVNGIYFKASWYEEFDVKDTIAAPFYMDEGKVAENVSFMVQSKFLQYAAIKELDATAVKLSFKVPPPMDDETQYSQKSNVYMLIILPNRQRTHSEIAVFEEKLMRVDFNKILKQFYFETVDLKLPKFKIETDVKTEVLKEALMKVS